MEELANLQKKFLEIQKSGGGFKLTERTVVDIINKVLSRGKIKINFTTNGREYVSDEKITKEIQDEILRNKGRISKVDLQKKIDVQTSILESRISALFSKDKNLNLIENNIITNYYLENMAREINYNLQATGNLLISEISNMYDFSIAFFKRFLEEKTGENRIIQGKYYPNRILTDEYIQQQMKKVRPLLIGSIMPISFAYMIETFKIDEFIIADLVEKLIKDKIVKGRVNANVFEPAIFEQSKIQYIKGCLGQNNYLEYNLIKNIGIKNPKDFILSLQKEKNPDPVFQNLIFLRDFVISNNLKSNFESYFFENYSKNLSTNLNSIFLFELSEPDIFTLLEKINVKPNCVILINDNLIPVGFLDEFVAGISPIIKEEASKQYNSFVNKLKEKEKKKKEEAEETNIKGCGKKGKGAATSKPAKKNKKQDSDDELNSNIGNSNIALGNHFLQEILTRLKKTHNLEEAFNLEETAIELFNLHLKEKLNKIYSQFVNEFINTKTKPANDPKLLINQIETEYLELKFMQKSMENLSLLSQEPSYQQALKAIIAHLCKKDLQNLLKNILTYQLIHMKSKIDLNKINMPNERKDIINTIGDEDLKNIFIKLNDFISAKNFSEFLNFLGSVSKDIAVTLTPFDKKKEKMLNEKYTAEFSKNLEEKKTSLGKGFKKDFVAFVVDFGLSKLLARGYFFKLPYESWVISIYSNIFLESSLDPEGLGLKALLTSINSYINLSDDDFFAKHSEVNEYVLKMLC